MVEELKGVRALVTGAGSGIGRAIGLRLSRGGCRVAVSDVKPERVEETAELIRKAGGEALKIVADVSARLEADRMVAETVKAFGGLDVLVNNAGVSSAGFLEVALDSEIDRVLAVNLKALMYVTRAAASHLKKSGRGRIINLSSVEGIRGSGLLPIYGASKAGVIGLTRSNAVELARFGVTANAICPGIINTDLMAAAISDQKWVEKSVKGIPMRRLGEPKDIAGAVAFLASAEASYITGNVIVIDGGQTVKAL